MYHLQTSLSQDALWADQEISLLVMVVEVRERTTVLNKNLAVHKLKIKVQSDCVAKVLLFLNIVNKWRVTSFNRYLQANFIHL